MAGAGGAVPPCSMSADRASRSSVGADGWSRMALPPTSFSVTIDNSGQGGQVERRRRRNMADPPRRATDRPPRSAGAAATTSRPRSASSTRPEQRSRAAVAAAVMAATLPAAAVVAVATPAAAAATVAFRAPIASPAAVAAARASSASGAGFADLLRRAHHAAGQPERHRRLRPDHLRPRCLRRLIWGAQILAGRYRNIASGPDWWTTGV